MEMIERIIVVECLDFLAVVLLCCPQMVQLELEYIKKILIIWVHELCILHWHRDFWSRKRSNSLKI